MTDSTIPRRKKRRNTATPENRNGRKNGHRTNGQIVKSDGLDGAVKQALSRPVKPKATLQRTTFCTPREMDFFSEKELTTQTGHDPEDWPLVFVKEVIDNALDACEEADQPPSINISADATGISVEDNGPGLPESTLRATLDFTVRASNREAYVSPCRGAQGNALMTLLAMPVVIDPDDGRLIVEAHGKRHTITCSADPITQRAVVHDDVSDVPKCKKRRPARGTRKQALSSGTKVRIQWGEIEMTYLDHCLWPFGPEGLSPACKPSFFERFLAIIEGFALFNPHATFRLDWFGEKYAWDATDPAWEKWKPNKPTSTHWYEGRHLERLIGAYITHDRDAGTDRLVSDLVVEFDGLTGSQKRSKVLDETDLRRVRLSEFVVGGRLDTKRIGKLLASMQRHTRTVKSRRLGIIGEDHLKARLLAMGVQPESFRYSRKTSKEGLPWVLESAFGWLGNDSPDRRRIYSGANWSAAIKNPFRSFGTTGEGLETALSDMRATRNEPIVFVLHLAHPRVEYTDRGKSALVMGGAA